MKKYILGLILTTMLCTQLTYPCHAQSEKTRQVVTQAKQLLKQGRYSQVTEQLQGALKTASTDMDKAELLLVLAQATERMAATQREKSVESVTKARLAAVALDDQVVALPGATHEQKLEALKHAILYLKMEGRREEANEHRKRFLGLDGLNPKERSEMLQELASQTKNGTEALAYLEQAASLPGLSDMDRAYILLKIGKSHLASDKHELATESFQAVEGMAGLEPSWQTAAGLALTEVDLAAGRVKPASERIRSLVTQHSRTDLAQYTVLTLAKKFRDSQDPETFIFLVEYLSQSPAAPGNQTENALLELASYYSSVKQWEKAHQALHKLPFSRMAIAKDLDLYHKQGQADQLAQRFAKVVSLVKEERSLRPSDSLNSLWQQLPGLVGRYIQEYAQPKTKKAALSLLKSGLEFYPANTSQGKALQAEMKRIQDL